MSRFFIGTKRKTWLKNATKRSFFVLVFIHFRLHTLVVHQPTTINKQTVLSALLLVKKEGRHQPTAINKTNKHVLLLSYWSISTNQKLRLVDIFKSASRAITWARAVEGATHPKKFLETKLLPSSSLASSNNRINSLAHFSKISDQQQ